MAIGATGGQLSHLEYEKAPEQDAQDRTCTLRRAFWVAAAMGWVVWLLSVIAALDDAWLQFDGDTFISAGDEPYLQFCNELELSELQYEVLRDIFDVEKLCNLYLLFTVFQFVGTVVCSFAVLALTIAWVRPAASQRVPGPAVGLGGGLLMAIYAGLQTVAFSLAMDMKDLLHDAVDDYLKSTGIHEEYQMGPTFWVTVTASGLGLILAITLMVSFQDAGDGPFYGCSPVMNTGTGAVGPVSTEA